VDTALPKTDPVYTTVPMADPVEPLDTAVEKVEPWVRPWEDIFNDTQPEALQAVKPFAIADPVEANFDDTRPEAGDTETVQSDSAYKDEEDPFRRKVDLYLDLKSIHTLQYIAGRISKKLSTEFPELKGSRNESCTWINLKNSGGLDYPSNSFMEDVKKMEIEFRLFHGEKINMSPNPIENLCTLIMKRSTLPERVILYFVKIRFFHRLKELNLKLSGAKVPIRTLKQHGQFIN